MPLTILYVYINKYIILLHHNSDTCTSQSFIFNKHLHTDTTAFTFYLLSATASQEDCPLFSS